MIDWYLTPLAPYDALFRRSFFIYRWSLSACREPLTFGRETDNHKIGVDCTCPIRDSNSQRQWWLACDAVVRLVIQLSHRGPYLSCRKHCQWLEIVPSSVRDFPVSHSFPRYLVRTLFLFQMVYIRIKRELRIQKSCLNESIDVFFLLLFVKCRIKSVVLFNLF